MTVRIIDQPGESLYFDHIFENVGVAYFAVNKYMSFRGRSLGSSDRYVSKLKFGQNISSGPFSKQIGGAMAIGSSAYRAAWEERGIGYIGFGFNNGTGNQYGWVRVKMAGAPDNGFIVEDYAYGDPGEPVRAGQRSSDEQAPDPGSTDEDPPDQGSLGGLALGGAGLLAWRKSRSRTARLEHS
jgi:hypothetical protein